MFRDGSYANASIHCLGLPRPSHNVDCHIPCPYDCIVSEWSVWTLCPSSLCSQNNHHHRLPLKQRNRTIIASSGKDGQSCPSSDSLMEMEACAESSLSECEWFKWQIQEWEECQ